MRYISRTKVSLANISGYESDRKEFIEMKIFKSLAGDTTTLDDRFETIMGDIEYMENKINELKDSAAVETELDLMEDLLSIFRGSLNMKKTHYHHRLNSIRLLDYRKVTHHFKASFRRYYSRKSSPWRRIASNIVIVVFSRRLETSVIN